MLMYRKDLFAKAGLAMPETPSWDFIKTAADKNDRDLRHPPAQ